MSDRMLEVTINHARTCNIHDDKLYLYRASNCAVLLNPICQVMGAVFDGLTYWPNQFTPMQQVSLILIQCPCQYKTAGLLSFLTICPSKLMQSYVQQLVLEAFRHWDRVEEVDGSFNPYSALLQSTMFPSSLPGYIYLSSYRSSF